MNFDEELRARTAFAEQAVESFLPAEEGFARTVISCMDYSVRAGGKRLRPLIMAETFRVCGGEGRSVEPFMAAMEMIHTFSLIHDDLPAMDNDELRRGRPTAWKAYGEDMAILAGDGLAVLAFETALISADLGAEPAGVIRALRILAEKTGIRGMIGGQTLDVELTGRPVDDDQMDFIYRLKTGALIEASFMIGAVLAGAPRATVEIFREAGAYAGYAFQIEDDILEATSTADMLGKPVDSDAKNGKYTYVSAHGLEAARSETERLSEAAVRCLRSLNADTEFLEQLVMNLTRRNR
mgnify:FL=1